MEEPPTSHREDCERLYVEMAAGLVLYGRALGLGRGESEDVLQEVFVRVLREKPALEQPRNYLIRAFRNRALNHKRSLWRRLTRELESSRWFERDEGSVEDERRAVGLLKVLPAAQREVVVLKIWHRLTFAQIAAVLEESPNTIAGRYRYAMARMRNGFAKGNDDESSILRRQIEAVDAT